MFVLLCICATKGCISRKHNKTFSIWRLSTSIYYLLSFSLAALLAAADYVLSYNKYMVGYVCVCLKVLLLPGPVLIADNIWCTSLFTFVFVLVCTDVSECVCVCALVFIFIWYCCRYQRCCGSRCSFISVIGLFWTQPTSHLHRLQCAPIAATMIGWHHTHTQTNKHTRTTCCARACQRISLSLWYCSNVAPLIRYAHASACQCLSFL